MSEPVLFFGQIDDQAARQVGGKGLNLGLMTRAGIDVPEGFCITADCHREARAAAQGLARLTGPSLQSVLEAYARLGGGPVAVRSSATDEDGAEASFAGQQETILGVTGDEALIRAIEQCWASLESERAVAYRAKRGMADDKAAMGVVVQKLVESEVSGVLFTHDPMDRDGRRMLVESAWGLGEMIVSGRIQPDRFHIDRQTGEIVEQQLHAKPLKLTSAGLCEIPPDRQSLPSLEPAQLQELARAGRVIEEYYGQPRDVEWAWADGRLWILQARPITTLTAQELHGAMEREIAAIQRRIAPGGTIWARYNLAEVLPDPTPMSWAIVRHFMSGLGGFGQTYRDLGFDPDPGLGEEGFFDLICGRPYVNLSREPRFYFKDFPYRHNFKAMKSNPARALYPAPKADRSGLSAGFFLKLPATLYKMLRVGRIFKRQRRELPALLRSEIFPRFAQKVTEARKAGFEGRADADILAFLRQWIQWTLVDFARFSLRPSMLAAGAMDELEKGLGKKMGVKKGAALARQLVMGVRPDEEADVASAVEALAAGRMDRALFLERFGHRGSHEMELARPRWIEDPSSLPASPPASHARPADAPRHEEEARPAAELDSTLRAALADARLFLALRETAKHYFMMGYAMIRAALVELDRRHGLKGDIFYLTPGELVNLIAGDVPRPLMAERKRHRNAALSLAAPPVIFWDDLQAIGRPVVAAGATAELKGTAVSFGQFEGRAMVLREPVDAERLEKGFVLVCPSTDPAWVPLFLKAGALVMETGGVLSHGAIVAREFGIPAVAGIPDVCRLIESGRRLSVDGTTGRVHLLES